MHLAIAATLDDKSQLRKELEQKNRDLASSRDKVRSLTTELDVTRQQEAGLKEKKKN